MGSRLAERPLELQLPENLDAERFVLGSILIEGAPAYLEATRLLSAADFSLEKHKKIWLAIEALQEKGNAIDRVTVANYLNSIGQLQAVDGLSYLVALDNGMPKLANFGEYCQMVREKSMLRGIIHLALDAQDQASFENGAATEIAQKAAVKLLEIARQERTPGAGLTTVADYISADEETDDGRPSKLERLINPHVHGTGVKTGLTKFDDMTGGLRETELIILAARPAMGKSALAFGIGQHIAMRDVDPGAVAIFSLEMSKESILHRMACAHARVDLQRFRAGRISHEEERKIRRAIIALAQSPLYIDDTAGTNLADITVKLRHLQATSDVPLKLVIVDYLQLMQGRGRFENRVQEISALSRGFKLLAKELRVPFLVLSQLSRAPETRPGDHRPMLSDLRDSGTIEQDADMVAFVFREELYRPDKESLRGEAELILAKQRNGPTGKIRLAFLHQYTKFENRADDTGEEPAGFARSTAGDRKAAGLDKPFLVEVPKEDSNSAPWFEPDWKTPFDSLEDDRRDPDDF